MNRIKKCVFTGATALTFSVVMAANTTSYAEVNNFENNIQTIKQESVDYGTRIIKDDLLPAGVSIVEQEGEKGLQTFYKEFDKFRDSNGVLADYPIYFDSITKAPVEKIIRQGVNKEVIQGVSQQVFDEQRKDAERKARETARKIELAAAQNDLGSAVSSLSSSAVSSLSNSGTAGPAFSSSIASGHVTSIEENKAYARSILSPQEFACADELYRRESGWQTQAENPSSGAYGIVQSLPAEKLASEGDDWRTNGRTQINWGKKYVDERYGGYCQAVAAHDSQGWY